jgi:hypothetical protein
MKLITAFWLAMWLNPVAGHDSPKVNQVMTFSYPFASSGIIHLLPTIPLPQIEGTVRVVRGSIVANIDVLVDNLPPAQDLGGNLNAYVVWLISPDGDILNLGELRRNGDSGILHTATTWGAFGVFVTAEPDNCETCPGTIVLVNDPCVGGLHPERLATIACGNAPKTCSSTTQ